MVRSLGDKGTQVILPWAQKRLYWWMGWSQVVPHEKLAGVTYGILAKHSNLKKHCTVKPEGAGIPLGLWNIELKS